jgi:hypothetical protein
MRAAAGIVVVYCPVCRVETMPDDRSGRCWWCDSLLLPRKPTGFMATDTPSQRIMRAAAAHFGVDVAELTAPARGCVAAAQARVVAMYLARELTSASLRDVARTFNRGDHTTVASAVRRVRSNPALLAVAGELTRELRAVA